MPIATDAVYGTKDNRRGTCKATALVRPAADNRLTGGRSRRKFVHTDRRRQGLQNPGSKEGPGPLVVIKMRRQGETLRVVVDERGTPSDTRLL